MKKYTPKHDLVLVIWRDAFFYGGWHDGMKARQHDDYAYTVGYLLRKDKHSIVVSQSLTDGANGNKAQIPRKMIQKIKKLRVK